MTAPGSISSFGASSLVSVLSRSPLSDLALLAYVKDDWSITGTSRDAFLSRTLDRCSAAASVFCNRRFGRSTYKEVIRVQRDRNSSVLPPGMSPLWLAQHPVSSVVSVVESDAPGSDGGVALTNDQYALDPDTGRLFRLDCECNERVWSASVITVTYVAGYTLPYTLSSATLSFVAGLDKIADAASGLGKFQAGAVVDVQGSTHNSGSFLIGTASPGALALTNIDGTPAAFTAEAAGPLVTVSNTVDPGLGALPPDITDAVSRMVWARYTQSERDPLIRSQSLEGEGSVTYMSPSDHGNMSDDVQNILEKYRVPVLV